MHSLRYLDNEDQALRPSLLLQDHLLLTTLMTAAAVRLADVTAAMVVYSYA